MRILTAMALLGILGAVSVCSRPPSPGKEIPDDLLRPIPFTAVTVNDAFWAPRIETNRTVTIPFIFQKNEETGRLDNFAIAGGLMEGRYKGQRYNDTDVYKTIEGASYSLMVHPDPELDADLDRMIAMIAAAQEEDGYLFTARTASPDELQPGIGAERWSELAVSHELYNAGHMYEAAVAHFMATGKRSFLDVAVKNADLLVATFGPGRRKGFPGHQEIELALVKLARVTGNGRYIDLARYFLDQRGRGLVLTQYPPGNRFAIYNEPEQIQAHLPVLEQDEAVGHAVRAAYMFSAMADIAAIDGDRRYLDASKRLWENVVGKKMYLIGGIGSHHDRERFGGDFELPNRTAYAETCASIGMVFWNHRMFLLTGESRYIDVMERAMYNGVISGVSLEGDAFFYPNPLESDGAWEFNKGTAVRAPWFDVACCPGNISRFIPSMPGYVYAAGDDALYVNLFVQGSARADLGSRIVAVRQETRYPWEGHVRIVLEPEKAGRFAVHVRIPGWAGSAPVPTDLYRYGDALPGGGGAVEVRVNGKPVPPEMDKGYARILRLWKAGDAIDVVFPMAPRRVVSHPAVAGNADRTAVERGPIVYCAEGPDNGGRVLDLVLPDDAELRSAWRPDLLGGVMIVEGTAVRLPGQGDKSRAGSGEFFLAAEMPLTLIPYYAWAHRGPAEMTVWLPKKKE